MIYLSYQKTTWQYGKKVTSALLNNIEDGIEKVDMQIDQKAPVIISKSDLSFDTDFFAMSDISSGNDYKINALSSVVERNVLLLSKSKNLLPTFDRIFVNNSVNGINGTINGLSFEFVDGTTLKINGTATANTFFYFSTRNSNSFVPQKPLTKAETITVGCLSSGNGGVDSSRPQIAFQYKTDAWKEKIARFTGGDSVNTTITTVAASNEMRINVKILAGVVADNFIVTPYAFAGTDVVIVNNPVYIDGSYEVAPAEYIENGYISTYPNRHELQYKADTKAYIDSHASNIDMSKLDALIASEISNVKTDISQKITFITPEMYGAKGNGSADDTQALQN